MEYENERNSMSNMGQHAYRDQRFLTSNFTTTIPKEERRLTGNKTALSVRSSYIDGKFIETRILLNFIQLKWFNMF